MFNISLFASSWAGKTDDLLVQATQNGDSSAFEAIYEKYHKQIYSYLRNMLNYNYDDTVSITSDVFIKFYEYVKKNKVTNTRSILYRIAHNAAVDWIRSNQTQRDFAYIDKDMEFIADKNQIKDDVDIYFKNELLKDLLSKLDQEQREILYLYYQEWKSYEEISDILGKNKNTIWTLIFNAKKKLNNMAKNNWIEEWLLV